MCLKKSKGFLLCAMLASGKFMEAQSSHISFNGSFVSGVNSTWVGHDLDQNHGGGKIYNPFYQPTLDFALPTLSTTTKCEGL